MRRKKGVIVTLLFVINMVMLVAAVFPHHHHPNGMICMKQDTATEQEDCPAEQQDCPTEQQGCPSCEHHRHQHHPKNDACCNSECITQFHSPTPSVQTDSRPDYGIITTLFTDGIIEHLLKPQERRVKNYYVYRDSLQEADAVRTVSLRAPPYAVFA